MNTNAATDDMESYISETVFWDTSLSEQDVYGDSQCSYLISDSEPIAYSLLWEHSGYMI